MYQYNYRMNKHHILYVDGHVYISHKPNNILLYNFIESRGQTFYVKDDLTNQIFSILSRPENANRTVLPEDYKKSEDLCNIIQFLHNNFWGDVIILPENQEPPACFMPICNLEGVKSHTLNDLQSITIALNGTSSLFEIPIQNQLPLMYCSPRNDFINYDTLISFLGDVPNDVGIRIIGGDLSSYPFLKEVLTYLQSRFQNIAIFSYYKFYDEYLYSLNVNKNIIIRGDEFYNTGKYVKSDKINLHFIVDSRAAYRNILNHFPEATLGLNKYVWPINLTTNSQKIRLLISFDKKTLTKSRIQLHNYFLNKILNRHFYGQLYIAPSGNVHTNYNFKPIGTIHDSIMDCLNRIDENDSWFHIRNFKPCSECVFQWLCPPPTNYEISMGIKSLCQ